MKKQLTSLVILICLFFSVFTTNAAVNYTVTFTDYNNSVLKTETVNQGDQATAPSDPLRTGYTFNGWDNPYDNITSSITIKAQYAYILQSTDVSFDKQNGYITEYTITEKDIHIPDTLEADAVKYAVEGIEKNVFRGKDLTSIILPNSMKYIGDYAFLNNELSELIIPASLEKLGYSVFSNNLITEIVVPGSIEKIPNRAFSNNKLIKVTIQEGCKKIDYGAFKDNEISELNLPNSLKSIGGSAFANSLLTELNITQSGLSIGGMAFSNNMLTSVTLPADIIIWGGAFNNNQITKVNRQPSDGMFFSTDCGKSNNTAVVSYGGVSDTIDFIPATITKINSSAFNGCEIDSVVLPNAIEFIGGSAFAGTTIKHIDLPETLKIIGEGAFQNGNIESITIPESVIFMGSYAFSGCNLKEVTIPTGIKYLGDQVFFSNQLESVTLHDGIESIGSLAFVGNKLKNIDIPDSVKCIGDNAFGGNLLTKIKLPEGNGNTTLQWVDRSSNTYSGGDSVDISTGIEYNVVDIYPIRYIADFWANNENPLTYNSNEGLILKAPIKDGYIFTGWNDWINGDVDTIPVGSTNYYGLCPTWQAGYLVTFNDYEGNTIKVDTVICEVAAVAPVAPTRNGYSFDGWDKLFDEVTSNITVTAQYSVIDNIDEEEYQYSIYPNPASNYIYIEGVDLADIEIITLSGTCIKYISNVESGIQIDISDIEDGIYLIRVNNQTKRVSIIR